MSALSEMPLEGPVRDPMTVACPRCEARPTHGCHTVSNTGLWSCRVHLARWKAIGVSKPTFSDRHNSYVLLKRYQLEALQTVTRRIRDGALR